MSMQQLDGNKPICIDSLGYLSMNGTRPIVPDVESETGFKTFMSSVPGQLGVQETRYVHVEVFRTFSNIVDIPRLEPEDVVFLNEKANPREAINNLMLSESGRVKVYGDGTSGEEQAVPVGTQEPEVRSQNEADTSGTLAPGEEEELAQADACASDEEDVLEVELFEIEEEQAVPVGTQEPEVRSQNEEGTSGRLRQDEADASEALAAETQADACAGEGSNEKVFVWRRSGSQYDLIDPSSDESVLLAFGESGLLRGKVKRDAADARIREEFGISTSFE